MSDDISAAPEVQAVLESNRHQQIILFVHISINGHSADEDAMGRHSGKRRRGRVGRRQWRDTTGLLCEFTVKGVVLLRPKLSGQVSREQLGT